MARLTPRPHQAVGIEYGKLVKDALLFMEPRSGKTLVATRIVEGVFPIIILAPATVLATWYAALLQEGVPEEGIVIMDGRHKGTVKDKRSLLVIRTTTHLLINFEKVVKSNALFCRQDHPLKKVYPLLDWRAVILDESYRIANMESTITQYLLSREKPLYQQRLLLSGFPICESGLDLASQAIFSRGSFYGFSDPLKYRDHYWREITEAYKWVPKNSLHKRGIIRWNKENAYSVTLKELGLGGEVLQGRAILPINDEQQKLMRIVALSEVYRMPQDDEQQEARPMLPTVRAIFLQKIASGIHPYTNEIVSEEKQRYIIEKYKADREPILVLSRFRAPMYRLVEMLKEAGIEARYIDGSVSLQDREKFRLEFQEGIIDIVVAQVKTVKMGLDFSRLKTIFYLSNGFSFDDRAQSQLRGQHLTRTLPYDVVDVCTEHTADIDLSEILVDKGEDARKYLPAINQHMLELYQ